MRVTILSNTHIWGGTEVQTLGLANVLADRGHAVTIVCCGHDLFAERVPEVQRRFGLIAIPVAKSVHRLGWAGCASLVRGLHGDVLVIAKGDFDVGNWRLELVARCRFARIVTIEHSLAEPMPVRATGHHLGGWLPGLGLWWYRTYLNRRARSLGPHRIICVSDAVRRSLMRHYGFPAKKLTVVHNGIDIGRFQRNELDRQMFRQRYGISEEALVFGALGRLSSEKGYDTVIELYRRLTAAHPDRLMRLVISGDGPDRALLTQAALRSGVGEQIIFTGFTDQPWTVYPAFDVFVMPSRIEGLPLALLEAMACGCYPIAYGIAGIPEVISEPALGHLVRPNDCEGFYQAMDTVLRLSPEQPSESAHLLRGQIRQHFNASVQFAALADVIEGNGLGKPAVCVPESDPNP